jgi:hypothetical protein
MIISLLASSSTLPHLQCNDFLTPLFANDDDVCKAIMQPLDGISSFNVKGHSRFFAPLLKFIWNLSLFTQTFRAAWKKKQ